MKPKNCPLFLETARAAESSQVTVTSDFVACADGCKRIGIAAPFKAEDGSTQVVVMLYSQASLENMLDSPPLNDNGRFGIIDENGSMVLGQSSEEAWFKNGLFSFGESGALKEKLLTIARTTDGAKIYSLYKSAGNKKLDGCLHTAHKRNEFRHEWGAFNCQFVQRGGSFANFGLNRFLRVEYQSQLTAYGAFQNEISYRHKTIGEGRVRI